MKIDFLVWDTSFFGFKVSKLQIFDGSFEQIEDQLNRLYNKGNKLIYLFSEEKTVSNNILKKYNGKLVDKKIIYRKHLEDKPVIENNIKEYTQNKVVDKLKKLALQSGEYSRFRVDDRLPDCTFERMYSLWIDKSINKELADKVFIYEIDERIAGFVTLSFKNGYSEIGLIAVDTIFRGKKIGSHLLNYCEYISLQSNLNTLIVSTQSANKLACDFYEKNGYKIDKVIDIYHFIRQDK